MGFFQVGVIVGGSFLGGNCQGGSYPGWEFSLVGVFRLGIALGGIIHVGVFLVPFFENKTKKIKKVSVCKRSLFDFISYMFISLALSKQLRQKQIK